MINLNHISHLYFIGIGGIGMSALARYFYGNGKQVSGYDKTPSVITQELQDLGIDVHFKDQDKAIIKQFPNKENTLVVYTPAIPESMGELVRFRESAYHLKKRAEVLGMIANSSYCLAVAGTHGKTTTSSILGHLLAETNAPVTAFIGGITNNYNSNLIQKGNDVIVVEADEFDRSFLQLQPKIACITSMDPDHLDIYEDQEDFENTFKEFAAKVSSQHLFVKNGLSIAGNTVGINDDAMYSAQNITIVNGHYVFDFKHPDGVVEKMQFNLPGQHNLFNAVTALGMAMSYGTPADLLPDALGTYSGVNRRFSVRLQTSDLVLIDDYAHHPTEIAAVYQSVREMYPNERVMAVFQPHLYSRTQDFMEQFALELSRFDEVVLLDIYPARELPIEGVSSDALLQKITTAHKSLVTKGKLAERVLDSRHKIVVMMGAGDIGVEILKITKTLVNAS